MKSRRNGCYACGSHYFQNCIVASADNAVARLHSDNHLNRGHIWSKYCLINFFSSILLVYSDQKAL